MSIEKILATKYCTNCGTPFKPDDPKFPYPPKQVLCKKCFDDSLKKGLKRLNQRLAGESET